MNVSRRMTPLLDRAFEGREAYINELNQRARYAGYSTAVSDWLNLN